MGGCSTGQSRALAVTLICPHLTKAHLAHTSWAVYPWIWLRITRTVFTVGWLIWPSYSLVFNLFSFCVCKWLKDQKTAQRGQCWQKGDFTMFWLSSAKFCDTSQIKAILRGALWRHKWQATHHFSRYSGSPCDCNGFFSSNDGIWIFLQFWNKYISIYLILRYPMAFKGACFCGDFRRAIKIDSANSSITDTVNVLFTLWMYCLVSCDTRHTCMRRVLLMTSKFCFHKEPGKATPF